MFYDELQGMLHKIEILYHKSCSEFPTVVNDGGDKMYSHHYSHSFYNYADSMFKYVIHVYDGLTRLVATYLYIRGVERASSCMQP